MKDEDYMVPGVYREDNRRKLNPAVNDIDLELPAEQRFFKVDMSHDERPLPAVVNKNIEMKTHIYDYNSNEPLVEGNPNDQVISTKLVSVKDLPTKQ